MAVARVEFLTSLDAGNQLFNLGVSEFEFPA